MKSGRMSRAGSIAALMLVVGGCGSTSPPTQPGVASPLGSPSSATISTPPARSSSSGATGSAPPVSEPACAISSLAVTRAAVQGTVSTVTIDIDLANMGAQPCSLDGSISDARLDASDGTTVDRVLPPRADATPAHSVALPAMNDASAVLAFHWSNYCGAAHAALRIVITLPPTEGTLMAPLDRPLVPACLNQNEPPMFEFDGMSSLEAGAPSSWEPSVVHLMSTATVDWWKRIAHSPVTRG